MADPAGIYIKSGGVVTPASSTPGTGPTGSTGPAGSQGQAAAGVVVSPTAPTSPTLGTLWIDTSGITTNYDSAVMANSPLAYWKLNEASGTSAADSSGNSRTATYTNTPLLGAVGLIPSITDTSMATTSDSGQCTTIASASWMDTSDWTYEAIVNFTSGTDGSNGDAIISRYVGAATNILLWRNTSGQLASRAMNAAGTTYNISSGITVTLGATYHIAATYNQSQLILYVSGQPVSSVNITGAAKTTAAAIEIGRYSQSNPTTPGARIARAAVYGTALSPTNIYNHWLAVQ